MHSSSEERLLSNSNETAESVGEKKNNIGPQRVLGHLMRFVSERRRQEHKKEVSRIKSRRSYSRITPSKPNYTSPGLKSSFSQARL